MNSTKKIIGGGFYLICFVLLIITALVAVTSHLSIPGGYKVFSVATGSMNPTISEGSLIISQVPKNENEIHKNTIITFEEPGYENKFVTHRVYQLVRDESGVVFITKGDKNIIPDHWVVPYGKIQGIYKLHIPFIGKFFSYTQTPPGLIVFVIVPTILLIFHELKGVGKILVSMKLENKNR